MISIITALVIASTAPWSCDDEDARITAHLEDALAQLKTVTPPGLSEEQRRNRVQLIGDLRRYIDEKVFPRNSGEFSPVFVDDDDRHCAMGALIAWNGGREIVQHIRATRNLATVPRLVDEPGLAAWLNENGMAVEEAALVQPTYYGCAPTIDVCVNRGFPPSFVVREPVGVTGYWRAASADGACVGERTGYLYPFMPDPFPVAESSVVSAPGFLSSSGDDFVHASWSLCRDALIVPRAALEQATLDGCIRAMVAADPRSLIPWCGGSERPNTAQRDRCGVDGRFLSRTLPEHDAETVLRAYLRTRNLDPEDGGFPYALAEAVLADAKTHTDLGGTAPSGPFPSLLAWNGVNPATCSYLSDGGIEHVVDGGQVFAAGTFPIVTPDAGQRVDGGINTDGGLIYGGIVEEAAASRGCSTASGLLLALVSLLTRTRSPRSSFCGRSGERRAER